MSFLKFDNYRIVESFDIISIPVKGEWLGRVFKFFDPPQPPLKRGENPIKVPLFKGDLGGSHRQKRSQ